MREQRERVRAEKERDEARTRLKELEAEGDPFKTAKKLWQEKKYSKALKTGFGVDKFDDDFLVQVASDEPEAAPLTEEQLTERIRKQLEQERQAQEEAHTAQLHQMRAGAIQEVGGHLIANQDSYPTVWALGVTGEALGAFIDQLPERWGTPPDKVFEALEQSYRGRVQGLPWLPKAPESAAPTPAPRSFGSESRRGPVDQPDPAKPLTFEERKAMREQREKEWRARVFAPKS